MHILYIDDNKAARLIFEEAFKEHDLTIAESVDEAVEYLKETINQYDVIISDVIMPVVDGLSFVKMLSASSINTPFILTSAALNLHDLNDYTGLKNYLGFLLKPLEPEKVMELVCPISSQKNP